MLGEQVVFMLDIFILSKAIFDDFDELSPIREVEIISELLVDWELSFWFRSSNPWARESRTYLMKDESFSDHRLMCKGRHYESNFSAYDERLGAGIISLIIIT